MANIKKILPSLIDSGNFTIIGDAVNIAARLADIARATEILASEGTLDKLPSDTFKTEYVEDIIPRGMTKKINYYRLADENVAKLMNGEICSKIDCNQ